MLIFSQRYQNSANNVSSNIDANSIRQLHLMSKHADFLIYELVYFRLPPGRFFLARPAI